MADKTSPSFVSVSAGIISDFLISFLQPDPELAAGGEEEITDKSCKMRYAQVFFFNFLRYALVPFFNFLRYAQVPFSTF